MNKVIGLALLGIGVVLLIFGFSAAESPASDISRLFTGEPTDRAIWLIVGGVASLIAGAVMAGMSWRNLKKA